MDGRFSALRQKCLHRLMTGAVRTRTAYTVKGIEIVLEVGEVAASDVELAALLGCNRKTVGKLIDSFNRLGMLTTRTNNRTSVHALHFLTGWYVNGALLTNPHYVRPSANADGQTQGARTPQPNDMPPKDGHHIEEERQQGQRHGAVSLEVIAAGLLSSLLSQTASDREACKQETGNHMQQPDIRGMEEAETPHSIDSGRQRQPDNPSGSQIGAQEGTNGNGTDLIDAGSRRLNGVETEKSGTLLSWRSRLGPAQI